MYLAPTSVHYMVISLHNNIMLITVQVLRLRAADRPAEEVVQEIYAYYKDLQGTQADKEVQKLYASRRS